MRARYLPSPTKIIFNSLSSIWRSDIPIWYGVVLYFIQFFVSVTIGVFAINPLIADAVFALAGAPLYGYYTRVIQQAMDQEERPSQFTNWRALLRTGWKASIVVFLFGSFPETWLSTTFGPIYSGFAEISSVYTFTTPTIPVEIEYRLEPPSEQLVKAVILPIAMGNFARRERLSDVVDFEQYKKIFTSKTYIILSIALVGLSIIRGLYFLSILLFIGGFDITSANTGLLLLYLVLFLSILPAMAVVMFTFVLQSTILLVIIGYACQVYKTNGSYSMIQQRPSGLIMLIGIGMGRGEYERCTLCFTENEGQRQDYSVTG